MVSQIGAALQLIKEQNKAILTTFFRVHTLKCMAPPHSQSDWRGLSLWVGRDCKVQLHYGVLCRVAIECWLYVWIWDKLESSIPHLQAIWLNSRPIAHGRYRFHEIMECRTISLFLPVCMVLHPGTPARITEHHNTYVAHFLQDKAILIPTRTPAILLIKCTYAAETDSIT